MIEFKILKKSAKSRARIGILTTPHGDIETPAFVVVGTAATIKTLDSQEVLDAKTQLIIANTFHLHLRPGEEVIKKSGGIHKFMNLPLPVMTDSGGFQVFSLGFGYDLGVGKIRKYFPGQKDYRVEKTDSPRFVKITDAGVWFRSPIDGRKLFLGPKESIKIQESIGADIIFALDECTPPLCSFDYAMSAWERTYRWAKECFKIHKTKQALFGIVQGSKYQELREESAIAINGLPFDGFGIGGDMGESKEISLQILRWVIPPLDENKPRHLLGIGHLEDMELIIKEGVDLFDCIVPTHYARRGTAFTSFGRVNLRQTKYLKDKEPLDKNCLCFVCQTYKRNYLCHLIKAREITGLKLVTFHNLYYFNTFVENIRKKIKEGKI